MQIWQGYIQALRGHSWPECDADAHARIIIGMPPVEAFSMRVAGTPVQPAPGRQAELRQPGRLLPSLSIQTAATVAAVSGDMAAATTTRARNRVGVEHVDNRS
jgi:hypothetical protein